MPDTAPHLEPAPDSHKQRLTGARKVIFALIFTLLATWVLFIVENWVDQTEVGGELNRMMYRFVQEKLEGADKEDWPPVVVVDISDMPAQVRIEENQQVSVTSRSRLLELIQAAAQAGAAGIGVDIDFSPRNGHPLQPQDKAFLEACQKASFDPQGNPIPIRLGVYRTQADPPEDWLGSTTFSNLAASIAIPDVMTVPRRLPLWVGPPGAKTPLPGMSLAVSGARRQDKPSLFAWALEKTQIKHLDDHTDAAEFLVNLNWLGKIRADKPQTSQQFLEDGYDARHALCRGRIVLLGDAGNSSDTFVVPGAEQQVQGVFLHACGIATLLKGKPLLEMTGAGQFVLAIFLALAIFTVIEVVEYKCKKSAWYELNREALEKWLTRMIALILWIVGYLLVARTRLVWNSLIIGLGMFVVVDPALEKSFSSYLEKLWEKVRKECTTPKSGKNPQTPSGTRDQTGSSH